MRRFLRITLPEIGEITIYRRNDGYWMWEGALGGKKVSIIGVCPKLRQARTESLAILLERA